MAAALEGEGPPEGEIDERFEYDAPRFYDFDEGSPAGARADGWFDTEGPKGEGRERACRRARTDCPRRIQRPTRSPQAWRRRRGPPPRPSRPSRCAHNLSCWCITVLLAVHRGQVRVCTAGHVEQVGPPAPTVMQAAAHDGAGAENSSGQQGEPGAKGGSKGEGCAASVGRKCLQCLEVHRDTSAQPPLPPSPLAGKGAEWRRALASISNTKTQQGQQQQGQQQGQQQQQLAAASKPAAKQGTKRRAAAEPAGGSSGSGAAAAAAAGAVSRPASAAAPAVAQADGSSRRVAAPKPHHTHTTVARRSGWPAAQPACCAVLPWLVHCLPATECACGLAQQLC